MDHDLPLELDEFNLSPIEKPPASPSFLKLKKWIYQKRHKKPRDTRTKEMSYDHYQIVWEKFLKSEEWRKYDKLEDYCFPKIENNQDTNEIEKLILIQNKMFKISLYDWYRLQQKLILNYLYKFIKEDDIVVELGCGYGRNVFSLVALGLKNKIEGYEYTKTGFETCEKINDYFGCNLKFGRVDLTKNLDHLDLKGKTIFTHHVLEQIKYDTKEVVSNLLQAQPKQVIHFEPIVELAKDDYFGKLFKQHIIKFDYIDSLFTTLKSFENEDKLLIQDKFPNRFALNYTNQTSIIRWIPSNK